MTLSSIYWIEYMKSNRKTAKKSDKKQRKTKADQGNHEEPPREDIPLSNIHFKSIDDCRRLLSVVTNLIRKDRIDHGKGKLLIYAALSLSQILEKTNIEAKLMELKIRLEQAERDAAGRR
jgi:hypothetical protein